VPGQLLLLPVAIFGGLTVRHTQANDDDDQHAEDADRGTEEKERHSFVGVSFQKYAREN
jgi:hypothetical protein